MCVVAGTCSLKRNRLRLVNKAANAKLPTQDYRTISEGCHQWGPEKAESPCQSQPSADSTDTLLNSLTYAHIESFSMTGAIHTVSLECHVAIDIFAQCG